MTVMQGLATGGGLTIRGTERGLRVHRRDADSKLQIVEPKLDEPLKADDVLYVAKACSDEGRRTMSLQQFFLILRARWKIALGVLAIVVGTAIAASLLLPKRYTASTAVVVDVKSPTQSSAH